MSLLLLLRRQSTLALLQRRVYSGIGGGKGPEVVNNTTLAGDKIDPWHGSYHWIYERSLSVASLALIGGAVVVPSRFIDFAVGIVLPLHCHIGLDALITDYLPKRKFPTIYYISRIFLISATAGTLYGLYQYNTKDVGICEGVARIWKTKKDNAVE